ncbi:MAG: PadR family transcriptional regulator [Oscillospiraceae bacterium]|nr:PadR family transcriptional regulator [Oscillospiraceae bacterium]
MEKIILGILMLKRLTLYEIRNIIKTSFKSMCSDSSGSIQAALKRLLTSEMVTYTEFVENSVNKKQYSITDKGREMFIEWLSTPADMTNTKNMELGKFLFMGLLPSKKRIELLNEMLEKLEMELAYVSLIWNSVATYGSTDIQQALSVWINDPEYLEGILKATECSDANESANSIEDYQRHTIQYGIDGLQFSVDWFRALRDKEVSNIKSMVEE